MHPILEALAVNSDGKCPKAKTDHDWELVYRDGPTDTNDWKCRQCGATTTNRGPDAPR